MYACMYVQEGMSICMYHYVCTVMFRAVRCTWYIQTYILYVVDHQQLLQCCVHIEILVQRDNALGTSARLDLYIVESSLLLRKVCRMPMYSRPDLPQDPPIRRKPSLDEKVRNLVQIRKDNCKAVIEHMGCYELHFRATLFLFLIRHELRPSLFVRFVRSCIC